MERIPYLVIGTVIGLALVATMALSADMLLNRGNLAARHVHHQFPECSGSCHG